MDPVFTITWAPTAYDLWMQALLVVFLYGPIAYGVARWWRGRHERRAGRERYQRVLQEMRENAAGREQEGER